MKKLFIMMAAFTLAASTNPMYAIDQNDAQKEQLSQEEVANLTLLAESVMHGVATGVINGVIIGICRDSYGSIAPFEWTTVPLYTYLYSKYRKSLIDEKSRSVELVHMLGFASGHIAGIATGMILRAVVTVVLEQLAKELQLKWHATTSSNT
jgi:cell shape-determining protein MreD